MNKEPQQVDWSQQKPGTKAISRDSTNNFEFVEARSEKACFFNLETMNWESRLLNGTHTESTRHSLDDILLPWESGKATKRVPCGPEHFPPGTVVRTAGCQHWQAILWARPSGLGAVGPSFILGEEKYDRLMLDGIERSIDGGKTWLPCYVEVEA